MSSDVIDERVVQMQFDNRQFEKNTKKTMSTLDKLDKKLQFEGVSDSLEKVKVKFSALEVAVVSAIAHITSKVITLGTQLIKSLSIDNIASGWQKYGEKTISVGTMMAQRLKIAGKEIEGTAEKLEVINDQLEKLNWFTDETSYNFTDMVNAISKFTATGQDLDKSVNAMMGIANWAALSGANAQKASIAMTQLAQAMGQGYVLLRDYQSIQTLTMDTDEFREVVLNTAVELGELTKTGDKFITKTGKKFTKSQFTTALSAKWFTSDVLVKALGKYSSAVEEIYNIAKAENITASKVIELYGSQFDKFALDAFKASQEARTFEDVINSVKDAVSTGWSVTMEKIFGGYDEAKDTWTELANQLYDVFAEGGNFRNEILGMWRDMAGNKDLFGEHGTPNQGAFWNIYDAVIAVKDIITDAWNDIFDLSPFEDATDRAVDLGAQLKRISVEFRSFTKRVKETLVNNTRLKVIFQGLFNIIKIGIQSVRALRYAIDPIVSAAENLTKYLFDKTAAFGLSLTKVNNVLDKIANVSQQLYDIFDEFVNYLDPTKVLDTLIDFANNLFNTLSNINPVQRAVNTLKLLIDTMKASGGTADNFQTILQGISSVFNIISKTIIMILDLVIKNVLPIIDNVTYVVVKLAGVIAGIAIEVVSIIADIFVELNKMFIGEEGAFSSFGETIMSFIDGLPDLLKSLKPILISLVKVLGSLIKLLLVIPKALNNILINITGKDLFTHIENFFNTVSNVVNKITDILIDIFGVSSSISSSESPLEPIVESVGLIRRSNKTLKRDISNEKPQVDKVAEAILYTLTAWKEFLDKLKPLLSGIIKVGGIVLNILTIAIDVWVFIVDKIAAAVADIVKKMKDAAKKTEVKAKDNLTFLDVMMAIVSMLALLLPIIISIYWLVYAIKSWIAPVQYMNEQVADAIYKFGNSFNLDAMASLIRSIGFAMIALAAALMMIASIDDKKVWHSVGILGGFLAIILALIVFLTLIQKNNDKLLTHVVKTRKTLKKTKSNVGQLFMQMAGLITVVSLSLLIISAAIKNLANVESFGKLWASFGVLAITLTLILAFATILMLFTKNSKFNNINTNIFKKISVTMLTIGALLAIIAASIYLLAKDMDYGKIWTAFGIIGLMLGAIGAFFASLSILSRNVQADSKIMLTLSVAIVSLSVLLATISLSIKVLADLDYGKMWSAFGAIQGLLLGLAGFFVLLTRFSEVLPQDANSMLAISTCIVALSLLVGTISLSLIGLAQLDYGKMWSAVGAIQTLLLGLAGFFILLTKFSEVLPQDANSMNKIAVVMLTLGLTVATISASLIGVAQLNYEKMWNAIGAIQTLLLGLAGFFILLTRFADMENQNVNVMNKISVMMFTLSLTLATITGCLMALSLLNYGKMWSAVGAIHALLAGLSVFFILLTKATDNFSQISGSMNKVALAILSIGVLVMALTSAIVMLSLLDYDKMWMSILAVSTLMAGIAGFFILLTRFSSMTGNTTSVLTSISKVMLTMSAFVLSLVAAIAIIAVLNIPRMWNAIGAISTLMAGLAGFFILLTRFSKAADKTAPMLDSVSKVMLTLSVFILSLSIVFAIMSALDYGKVWSSVGALTVVLIHLMVFMAVLDNLVKTSKRLNKTITIFALMSGLLLAMGSAFAIMSAFDYTSILSSAAAIVSVLGMFALIILMIDKLKINPINIVVMATSVLMLSAALLIFANAMKLLGNIGWKSIAIGVGLFAASIVVLAIAAKLLSSLAPILLAVSLAVLILGAGLSLVAIAVQSFIEVLASLGSTIIENAPIIAEALSLIATLIIETVINAITTLLTKVTALLPVIKDYIVAFIENLIDIFINEGPKIIGAVITIIVSLLEQIEANIGHIMELILSIIDQILTVISSKIGNIVKSLAKILIEIIKGLTKYARDIMKNLLAFLMQLIEGLIDQLPAIVEQVFRLVNTLLDLLLPYVMKLAGKVTAIALLLLAQVTYLTIASLGTIGKLILDLLYGILMLSINIFIGMHTILFQAIRTLMYNLFYVMSEVMIYIAKDVPKLLGGAFGKVIGAVVEFLGAQLKKIPIFAAIGDAIQKWGKYVADSANSMFDQSIMNGQNVRKALDQTRNNINAVMQDTINVVREDAVEGMQLITNTVKDSIDDMNKVLTGETYSTGQNIAEGEAQGITDNSSAPVDAITDTQEEVIEAGKEAVDSHSPSRVFMQIGKNIIDGLTMGISDNSEEAKDSIFDLMNNALSGIQDVIDSDMDDLTIRPVMDLSSVTEGAADIASIMSNINGGSVSMSGSLASSVSSRMNNNKGSGNQNEPIINNNAGDTYVATFNVTSDNPEELAKEVDARLQTMHRQAKLAKGGVR